MGTDLLRASKIGKAHVTRHFGTSVLVQLRKVEEEKSMRTR
jgi:hypothetical protein